MKWFWRTPKRKSASLRKLKTCLFSACDCHLKFHVCCRTLNVPFISSVEAHTPDTIVIQYILLASRLFTSFIVSSTCIIRIEFHFVLSIFINYSAFSSGVRIPLISQSIRLSPFSSCDVSDRAHWKRRVEQASQTCILTFYCVYKMCRDVFICIRNEAKIYCLPLWVHCLRLWNHCSGISFVRCPTTVCHTDPHTHTHLSVQLEGKCIFTQTTGPKPTRLL